MSMAQVSQGFGNRVGSVVVGITSE
jgi:hypothetical protein